MLELGSDCFQLLAERVELLRHRNAAAHLRTRHETAGDRSGEHRDERQPAEHQKGGDHLADRLIRDDIAVADGRDGLKSPPHPEPDAVERLRIEDPLEHTEDDDSKRPERPDQIRGIARTQTRALDVPFYPLLEMSDA